MAYKVLIVDDEAVFRNYIRQMGIWSREEFELAGEAGNTDEAMRMLALQNVDAVIFDVSMPGKSGVILSGMIASKYPSVSMVAVSSFDDYDYVREILKNGAHDYLLKYRLTEKQLETILRSLRDRNRNEPSWKTKEKLRRQAHDWFFGGGESPFTSDNSRKAITVIRFSLGKDLSDTTRETISEGISRILEENTTEKTDVLALRKDQECIVLLTRFYERISEAQIREILEHNKAVSEDIIYQIYLLRLNAVYCPVFFSDKAMRSYVLHKLEEKEGQERIQPMALTLTIGQQKRLLLMIENGDGERAAEFIREIFSGITEKKKSACFMIVRELLELIQKAAVEYQINLDFLPEDFQLYEYTKMRNKEKLADSIAGLYCNVIREIGENKKKEAGYSDIVQKAVKYLVEHYTQPITLRTVAEGIGTSASYLSRIFHDETGKTITDFMNEIRIKDSQEMLKNGYALKDVVGRCGFKNYNYFLKIFKKYTGKTPKEFLAEKE